MTHQEIIEQIRDLIADAGDVDEQGALELINAIIKGLPPPQGAQNRKMYRIPYTIGDAPIGSAPRPEGGEK